MADVIPFEAACARLQQSKSLGARWRREERAAALGELAREQARVRSHSEQEREKWMRDVETWPAPFRAPAAWVVENHTLPGYLSNGHTRIEVKRASADGYFQERTLAIIQWIRDGAGRLRASKTVEHGWVEKRRRDIDGHCRELLGHLWLYGRRRIERTDFEKHARRELTEELARIPRKIEATRVAIRRAQAVLDGGVVVSGERKGQPLTPGAATRKRSRVQNLKAEVAWLRKRRRIIETEPDPLIAWGLYTRAHRAPEVSR